MQPNSLHARGIASLVHQQTDLDRHAQEGAILIDRGEGCRVWDTEGREYIEAMAGLWCASLGFSERRLADAAHAQMLTLPSDHTFFQTGHEPAVELAERRLAIAPPGMARVLFQCGGSEANDAAIKLAWQYWGVQGKPDRRKMIGRVRAAAAGVFAYGQSELLPVSCRGGDGGGLFVADGCEPGGVDRGGGARDDRGVLRRAGAGRRGCDHAAAGVLGGDPDGAAERS